MLLEIAVWASIRPLRISQDKKSWDRSVENSLCARWHQGSWKIPLARSIQHTPGNVSLSRWCNSQNGNLIRRVIWSDQKHAMVSNVGDMGVHTECKTVTLGSVLEAVKSTTLHQPPNGLTRYCVAKWISRNYSVRVLLVVLWNIKVCATSIRRLPNGKSRDL